MCANCFRIVTSNRGTLANHNKVCSLRDCFQIDSQPRYIETQDRIICKGCNDVYDNLDDYMTNHAQPCLIHTEFLQKFNINNDKARAPLQQLEKEVFVENYFSFSLEVHTDNDIDNHSPSSSTKSVSSSNTTSTTISSSSSSSNQVDDLISEIDIDAQSKKRNISLCSSGDSDNSDEDVSLLKKQITADVMNDPVDRNEVITEPIGISYHSSIKNLSVLASLYMNDVVELEQYLIQSLDAVQQKKRALEKEEKDWKSCAVCKENEKSIVLYPCSHLCLCDNCSITMPQIKLCPICNSNIVLKVSNTRVK
jgi:hypothetical protein